MRNYQNDEQLPAPRKPRLLTIFELIMLVGAALALFVVFNYMSKYRRHDLDRFIFSIDILGISDVAKAENARLRAIDELKAPYEQRLALANRKVFYGADSTMVSLALGNPARKVKPESLTQSEKCIEYSCTEIWVYYLSENEATLFIFRDGILKAAERGSIMEPM